MTKEFVTIEFDTVKLDKEALDKFKMLFEILLDLKYFHDMDFTFSIDKMKEVG